MKIKLNRNIKVNKYKVVLDIGKKIRRSDILALLMISKSHNDTLSESIICGEFIFRDNRMIAERILRRCQEYKIIDENFKLTKDGIEARDNGLVYHPYTGVYYIWATEDPLIPQNILNLEIADEKIKFDEEVKGYKWDNKNGESVRVEVKIEADIIPVPEWLKAVIQYKNIRLVNEEKDEVRIESIDEKIERLSEPQSLSAEININKNSKTLKLRGLFEDEIDIPFFSDLKTIWKDLLQERYEYWDWNDNTLKVTFSDISDKEKKTFTTELQFLKPKIERFGEFNSFNLENIKIKPLSNSDANQWANWLLERNIQEYMFSKSYENYKENLIQKFPNFFIEFQDREDLLEKFRKKMNEQEIPDDFWYIQAPFDLSPVIKEED